jgi:hypothetical protein
MTIAIDHFHFLFRRHHHPSHHSTLPTASSITNPPISNTSGIIVNNIALALTIIR